MASGVLQLVHGRGDEPGAAHAQRMAERDGAAERVDPWIVVLKTEQPGGDQPVGEGYLAEFPLD